MFVLLCADDKKNMVSIRKNSEYCLKWKIKLYVRKTIIIIFASGVPEKPFVSFRFGETQTDIVESYAWLLIFTPKWNILFWY